MFKVGHRGAEVVQPSPLYLVLLFILVGIICVAWIVPLAVRSDPATVAPGLGSGGPEYVYIDTPCGCDKTHPVAHVDYGTTERDVSNAYFDQGDRDIPDPRRLSTFAWAWGQLVDHEITKSGKDTVSGITVSVPFAELGPAIIMSTAEAGRNAATQCLEPKNFLSPSIDGSAVYSDYKDPGRLDELRVGPGECKMRTDGTHGLPPLKDGSFFCGDERCGEHVVLTALHTLLLREHNRWCDRLGAEQPQTTGEQRFWWARALVVSIMQRITMHEWLPALFGSQEHLLTAPGAVPVGSGVGLTTEFSVQAFRFGHSMVGNTLGPWALADLFFDTDFIRTHGMESVLKAALDTPAQRVDRFVVRTLRDQLFGTHGLDLITFNLFRNRQLGGPTYDRVVECYGVRDTGLALPAGHPGHRDTLLGLLMEPLVPGSSLPRTIAAVLADTFRRLRDNDPRYFTRRANELGGQYYAAVGQTTLASLIIRNTDLRMEDVNGGNAFKL